MFEKRLHGVRALGLGLIGLAAMAEPTRALPSSLPGVDPIEPTSPPLPCVGEGTHLPSGRTYRVQGRIQQDCRQTDFGEVLPVSGYAVEVMARFQMGAICPSEHGRTVIQRVGSTATNGSGNYSFSARSDSLNRLMPKRFNVRKVEVSVRLHEPETNLIVWTSPYRTWYLGSALVIDYTMAADCPADRFSQPYWDAPVWRLQLRIWTADVADAGTDDSVQVRLNPWNNTWLDYGRDDFERNDEFTYDLLTTGIRQRSDITQLVIFKDRSDDWCIERAQLLVNEVPMFDQTFSSPGHWLDNEDGLSRVYTADYYALRSNAAWVEFEPPSLLEAVVILHDELVSRLEGLLGHLAHGSSAVLDGEHRYGPVVEIEQVDHQTLSVDFDLTGQTNNWDNAEIDIDFDVHFSCDESEEPLRLENLHVSIDAFLDSLTDADQEGEEKVRTMILDNFDSMAHRMLEGDGGACYCVALVDTDGDLVMGTRACPRPPLDLSGFHPQLPRR